jgi:glucan biosynthesis protein
MIHDDSLMVINKQEYEKLKLERDAAVEGFRQQFELAHEAIKQNNELREKLRELEDVVLKTHQKATDRIIKLEGALVDKDSWFK